MAKVYDITDRRYMHKECWYEGVGYTVGADRKINGKLHWLFRCMVGPYPSETQAIVEVTQIPDEKPSILTLMDKYGEMFVFWDEKPNDPYFKEGWPEWEVI